MIRAVILASLPLATSPALASSRIAQQPSGSIGVIDPQGGAYVITPFPMQQRESYCGTPLPPDHLGQPSPEYRYMP